MESGDVGAAFGLDTSYDAQGDLARAMVEEINATGGFAGRQLVPVIAAADQTDQDASTQSRIHNEICTSLTEDHGVDLVVAVGLYSWMGSACYAQHKTPVLTQSEYRDAADLAKAGPLVLPTLWMTPDRMAQVLPIGLRDQDFLSERMGLLGVDYPGYRRAAEDVLIPGIQRQGGKVIDKAYLPDAMSSATQLSSILLRFRQQNIDRVVIWFPGGIPYMLVARAAESQGWRPGWAVSSFTAPGRAQEQIPPAQLRNTVGTGFFPRLDQGAAQPPPGEREKSCFATVNKRAGTTEGRTTDNGGAVLALCDQFRLLQLALQPATGRPLSMTDVPALVDAVGTKFDSAQLPQTSFAPGKIDGAAQYAPFAFDDGCPCFAYRSAFRAIPR